VITLQLSKEEAQILSEFLQSALSDLRMEIADTEKMEWRVEMKKREQFLGDLIGRLEG